MSGALCFVSALRYRADSDKTSGPTPTRGASHSLRFLCSFFERFRKKTRKKHFLDEMGRIIPSRELTAAIEPFYPNPPGAGRRPVGVERMLRIYFLQHWFNLSDPGAEEPLYDSRALRAFVGIDLGREPVPDETTLCKFRHLMERHNLGDPLYRQAGISVNDQRFLRPRACRC